MLQAIGLEKLFRCWRDLTRPYWTVNMDTRRGKIINIPHCDVTRFHMLNNCPFMQPIDGLMIYINHFSCFLVFRPQVRDLVEKCTCPSQFPMIRVSEGKYRIGDTKVLIFVRVSRSISQLTHDLWRNGWPGELLALPEPCILQEAKDHRLNGKLMI